MHHIYTLICYAQKLTIQVGFFGVKVCLQCTVVKNFIVFL